MTLLARHRNILLLCHQLTHFSFQRIPFIGFRIQHILWFVVALVAHLDAVVNVVAHVVELVATLERKCCFSHGAELAKTPLLKVLVVDKVNSTDCMWQEVKYTDSDESAVESIALVIGSEALFFAVFLYCLPSYRRFAKKALEPFLCDFFRLVVVDMNLVVFVELKLLFSTSIGLQSDLEAMRWRNRLQFVDFCFVNCVQQVEAVSLSSFFSARSSSADDSDIETCQTYSLVLGKRLVVSLMYSSPSTNLFQLFKAFRWLVFAARDFAGSLENSSVTFG